MQVSDYINDAQIAHRLMEMARRAEAKRSGKKLDEASEQDEDKDSVELSGSSPSSSVAGSSQSANTEDTQINLSELISKLKELYKNPRQTSVEVQASFTQKIEIEASLTYMELKRVDGLVRNSEKSAETDRYLFEFQDGITFKITDKWTNRSTTIWGDPHVDVNDEQGNMNGDFKDMDGSNSQTTLMLQDDTRVTFTAKDDGVIEQVDIFKGYQHLLGIGQGSTGWTEDKKMFASGVDTHGAQAMILDKGDTVYAGGDGNDWFTKDGQLLWGKTTGPSVTVRPSALMQMSYKETVTQEATVQVNVQA